jgi:endogenous inhibitor of DNA gyrase (YacG/DUF329 family)
MNALKTGISRNTHYTDADVQTQYQTAAVPFCRKTRITGYVVPANAATVNCPKCISVAKGK